ncbi:MAG: hypothetical protein IPO81_05270 [Kouleothrix sp.]|nr:hypothetical protein [Kouleothrix sp.]
MRTLYKTLIMLGLAAAVALGVVWGGSPIARQQSPSATEQYIQKPGHGAVAFADVDTNIQKPGH